MIRSLTVGRRNQYKVTVYDRILMIAIKNPGDLYGLIAELRSLGVTHFRQDSLEFSMLPKSFDNAVDSLENDAPEIEVPEFGPRSVD